MIYERKMESSADSGIPETRNSIDSPCAVKCSRLESLDANVGPF